MADRNTSPQPVPVEQPQQVAPPPADEAKRLDETVEGGRYEINGVLVDCNGEPLKDQK